MNHPISATPYPSPEQFQQALSSPGSLRAYLAAFADHSQPRTRVVWLCAREEFARCSDLAEEVGFAIYEPGATGLPRLGEFVDASGEVDEKLLGGLR